MVSRLELTSLPIGGVYDYVHSPRRCLFGTAVPEAALYPATGVTSWSKAAWYFMTWEQSWLFNPVGEDWIANWKKQFVKVLGYMGYTEAEASSVMAPHLPCATPDVRMELSKTPFALEAAFLTFLKAFRAKLPAIQAMPVHAPAPAEYATALQGIAYDQLLWVHSAGEAEPPVLFVRMNDSQLNVHNLAALRAAWAKAAPRLGSRLDAMWQHPVVVDDALLHFCLLHDVPRAIWAGLDYGAQGRAAAFYALTQLSSTHRMLALAADASQHATISAEIPAVIISAGLKLPEVEAALAHIPPVAQWGALGIGERAAFLQPLQTALQQALLNQAGAES